MCKICGLSRLRLNCSMKLRAVSSLSIRNLTNQKLSLARNSNDPGSKHLIDHLTFKNFKWNFFNFDITKVAWLFFPFIRENNWDRVYKHAGCLISRKWANQIAWIFFWQNFWQEKASDWLNCNWIEAFAQPCAAHRSAQLQVFFERSWKLRPLKTKDSNRNYNKC